MGAILRLVLGFVLTRAATRGTAAGRAPLWLGLVQTLGLRRALPVALVVSLLQYLFRRARRHDRGPETARRVTGPPRAALPAPGVRR